MTTTPRRSPFTPALTAALRDVARGVVREGEPMTRHTSWRIGGPAAVYVEPADADDLAAIMRFCHQHGLPRLLLGGGSNLLVLDGGLQAVVLSLTRGLRELALDGEHIVAEAGCRIGRLLTFCATRGRAGLEFLADIPGTVGGVVAMNAGAMGGELRDVAAWLDLFLEDGTPARLDASTIGFTYRHAALPQGSVAVRASLRTTAGDPDEVAARVSALRRKRRAAQPQGPSCGSTFKNPPGHYAGRLIEEAGLKGARAGGALISPQHANFIVNEGGATAADVLSLIERARREVLARTGIALELEVKVVGEA